MAPRKATGEWKNRIDGRIVLEAPDQLLANPLNARRHGGAQRDAIRSSLGQLGWIAPVIVNVTTGNLLDGHARVEEALTKGVPHVPVLYVELSEDEERLALATYDPIGAMADYDAEVLAMLTGAVSVDGGDPLAALMGDLTDANPFKGLGHGTTDTTGFTPQDRLDAYEASDVRSLVLPFQLAGYEEVVQLLQKARDLYEVESNSDAIMAALRTAIAYAET
jgi:hypothetical protein